MSFNGYRAYRGAGGLADVDFTTVAASVIGPASSLQVAAAGHEPSTTYTYVVRPVRAGLECLDVSCAVEFRTDADGNWAGRRPGPVEVLEAEPVGRGQVRLRWTFRTRPGWAEVADFAVYYQQTPRISPGSPDATVAYAADGACATTLALTAGATYWFAVTARTAGGVESVLSPVAGPVLAESRTPPTPTLLAQSTF